MFGKNSPRYREWVRSGEYFKNLPDGIEVANLGSTVSCKDFDYALWRVSGANLASAPQPCWYDDQLIRQYARKIRQGSPICVCVCFFNFLVEHYPDDSSGYKYYFFLDDARIWHFDEHTRRRLTGVFPCLQDHTLACDEVIGTLRPIYRAIFPRTDADTSGCDRNKRMAGAYMDGWRSEFGWKEGRIALTTEQRETAERVYGILLSTLGFCSESGFRPYLIIPPVSDRLKELLQEDLLEDCFWGYIRDASSTGVPVIDLFHSDLFPDDAYFEDALTLSSKGREVFNSYIEREVLE